MVPWCLLSRLRKCASESDGTTVYVSYSPTVWDLETRTAASFPLFAKIKGKTDVHYETAGTTTAYYSP